MTGMRGVAAVGGLLVLAACGAAVGARGTPQPRTFTQPIYDAGGDRQTG